MPISPNRFTTAELLVGMKQCGHIPPAQTAFTDEGLLALGDRELETALLKQILSTRENYYLTYKDFDVATDGFYAIPPRAIATALAEIQIVNGTTIFPVSRSEISEQYNTQNSSNVGYTYYLKGNGFVIPNQISGTVRVWYYIAPNIMVLTTAAAQVTSIASNVLTCTSVPSTITTSTLVDAIQDQPHFGTISMDLTPTAVTSTTITFAAAITGLSVGDWIALAGQTPVPQIPKEFRALLIQRVAVKFCELQGYKDKLAIAKAALKEMEGNLTDLINPRVAESPKRIVPDGTLVGGAYRRWTSWAAAARD